MATYDAATSRTTERVGRMDRRSEYLVRLVDAVTHRPSSPAPSSSISERKAAVFAASWPVTEPSPRV